MKVLYIYQKGDCLSKIAKEFNTTVEKIAKLNGITNVDVLHAGDMIQIPSEGEINGNN